LTCSIQVADLDQSIKWYSDVLGFKLLYKVDEIAWAELATEIKGVNIGLGQVEKPAKLSGTKLTFGVKNVDASRKLLEQKKVRFDGPTQEIPGMVKLATFFDPTGNALMFYQDLQKA
jgi:predicted enzyme related to lactoylglutathione lyase